MMFLRRPTESMIGEFLSRAEGLPFSYAPSGLSSMAPPPGYVADHYRVSIGRGAGDFRAASAALAAWGAFGLSWTEIYPRNATMQVGRVVAVLARHLGFWSLNPCRVVDVAGDAQTGDTFSFAYGTVGSHVERGEERFSVDLDRATDTVWYEIHAVSRPRALIACLGLPISRAIQAKFRVESGDAMKAAVKRACEPPRNGPSPS